MKKLIPIFIIILLVAFFAVNTSFALSDLR